MFGKVLVANRGAVAARVLRCLSKMKVPAVACYSDVDARAPYLALAAETVRLGPGPAAASYLNVDAVLAAARGTGCDAIHPGYGFLSENAAFAQRVEDAGLRFIGPSPRWISAMGHKTRARALAIGHGLPVAKGSGILNGDPQAIAAEAAAIGYPLMVKPAGGGGGIGMIPVRTEAELMPAIERAGSLAGRGFGNRDVYLERLFERPRHIEIQVIGDRHGAARHVFERDCSPQRRNQKIIEESPAPNLPDGSAEELARSVASSMAAMGYDNIGTAEFLRAPDGSFTFLEMNTRLQVEHGVTEEVCGVDLVEAQIRSAAGMRLQEILPPSVVPRGHAIQARICAEDPVRFLPSPGPLRIFQLPMDPSIRVETGYAEGGEVSPFYDSLIAKVIVHRPARGQAIDDLIVALEACRIEGVKTNIPALLRILRSGTFRDGHLHTGIVPEVLT